jgi:hypothetical protein
MDERIITGLTLMILGGLQAIRPDIMLRFQTWTQRIIMGARYEPGPRTHRITRIAGAAFLILGLTLMAGIAR